MAKFRSIHNSLLGGELSPMAQGRTDLPGYPHSCKTLKNMIPLLSGGAYRRPGTQFDVRIDTTTYTQPILIPFSAPTPIEAGSPLRNTGPLCCILYTDRTTPVATPLMKVVPGLTTPSTDVTPGFTFPNAVNNAVFPSGNFAPTQYVQSGDTIYLANPYNPPLKILNTDGTITITEYNSGLTGTALRDSVPFMALNTTATTLAISAIAVGTGRTLTASATLFTAYMIGSLINVYDSGTTTWGTCKITAVTNGTTATADVIVAFGGLGATDKWCESAWSMKRGYPATVSIFEGRLCFGGNDFKRDDIWFSATGNFNYFSGHFAAGTTVGIPVYDPYSGLNAAGTLSYIQTDPFTLTLPQLEVVPITEMFSQKTLFISTQLREYLIGTGTDTNGVAGFGISGGTNVYTITAETNVGSYPIQAKKQDSEIFHVDRSGLKIKSFIFNYYEQAFNSNNLQITFDHYPKLGAGTSGTRQFVRIGWDNSRSTLWAADSGGNLISLTRDKASGVNTWARHELGGYDSTVTGAGSNATSNPTGSVLDLAVLPTVGGFDRGDRVYFVVQRKVAGLWYWYVEHLDGLVVTDDSAYAIYNQAHNFVDCAFNVQTIDNTVFQFGATFTGLTHLEGLSVAGTVINNHGVFPVACPHVVGGSATLTTHPSSLESVNSVVWIGLNHTPVVVPVRIEAGSQIGTAQGALKRINRAVIRFFNTMHCMVGRDANTLKHVHFKGSTVAMNKSCEFFSGDKLVEMDSDYDRDGLIYITQTLPLPMCIVAVIAEGQSYDG